MRNQRDSVLMSFVYMLAACCHTWMPRSIKNCTVMSNQVFLSKAERITVRQTEMASMAQLLNTNECPCLAKNRRHIHTGIGTACHRSIRTTLDRPTMRNSLHGVPRMDNMRVCHRSLYGWFFRVHLLVFCGIYAVRCTDSTVNFFSIQIIYLQSSSWVPILIIC